MRTRTQRRLLLCTAITKFRICDGRETGRRWGRVWFASSGLEHLHALAELGQFCRHAGKRLVKTFTAERIWLRWQSAALEDTLADPLLALGLELVNNFLTSLMGTAGHVEPKENV